MSDVFVNGVSIDSGMATLIQDLSSHLEANALSNHGLIAAYNFPPFADASSATVAKRIRQLGRRVDVISQDMSSIRKVDEDLTELVSEFVDLHVQLKGSPGFASWQAIRDYVLDGYSAVKKELLSGKYGFVYSRSMFPATHFLAAFIKIRHPQIFWISEFSDPVRHDAEGNPRPSQEIPDDYLSTRIISGVRHPVNRLLRDEQTIFAWCEILGVAASDRVIFTNEHQRDVMVQPYEKLLPPNMLQKKATISPHPTLGIEFYYRIPQNGEFPDSDVINIGYFGEFYPNRGVGELVKAVSGLEPGIRENIRVHVYTSKVAVAKSSLENLPFDTSFVTVRPAASLFTFFSLASAMDALYVSDVSSGLGYAENPYLPSKFSDYLGAEVPIIASVWPGSIMSKRDSIRKFFIGDVLGLQTDLSRIVLSWKSRERDKNIKGPGDIWSLKNF